MKICLIVFSLLFVGVFLFERFIISGREYTGDKTSHIKDGRFYTPDLDTNTKTLADLLKWRFGNNADIPWNEPYGTGTIDLVPLVGKEDIRATFINHATVLIESASTTIITDPIFSERASPFSFTGPKRHHDPYIALNTIPRIDIVTISHAHYDHLSIESIKMIEERFSPHYVVPLNNGQFVMRAGVPRERITELDLFESYERDGVVVTLESAQHWSARGMSDRNRYLWGSFMIQMQNKNIFFAGDTGYASHFKKIRTTYKNIDLALLPIGAYEPRWFMQGQHMNPSDAVQAGKDLGEPPVIGIHFGTFDITDEGRFDPEKDTKKALETIGYSTQFLVPTLVNGLDITI